MFFKKESEDLINGGELISTPHVTLTKETKDEYTYPQDGWYWFDKFDEALQFFATQNSELSITPLQAKLQLLEEGLLDAVEVMVKTNKKVELYWTNAQKFYRNDEILLGMATALGLSDAQLDDLFMKAGQL